MGLLPLWGNAMSREVHTEVNMSREQIERILDPHPVKKVLDAIEEMKRRFDDGQRIDC
jgi:hypothetical protein